jgi:hypothetical protein
MADEGYSWATLQSIRDPESPITYHLFQSNPNRLFLIHESATASALPSLPVKQASPTLLGRWLHRGSKILRL